MSTEPQHGISWGAGGVLVSATGPSDFENSDPEYGVLGILQGHLLALSPISPSLEVKTPQGSPETGAVPLRRPSPCRCATCRYLSACLVLAVWNRTFSLGENIIVFLATSLILQSQYLQR